MRKIEVNCFEITETEGDGIHEKHIAYADGKCVADAIAEPSKGWMHVRPFSKVFVIVQSLDEYKQLKNDAAREAALAKLTEADKKALGL